MSKSLDGEEGEFKGTIAVTSCTVFQPVNLSRHKSFRTLETTAQSIFYSSKFGFSPNPPDFFKAVLSSITSPGSLNVVVVYQNIRPYGDRSCALGCWCNRLLSLRERIIMNEVRLRQQQIMVCYEVHITQDFHLVLSVDQFGFMMDTTNGGL